MSQESHKETIHKVGKLLEETAAQIAPWFEVSDASQTYYPQDSSWSIIEILEHMTLTSHYLLLIIRKGAKKAVRRAAEGALIPAGEGDLRRLEPVGHPDTFPWLRPSHMEPTRMLSLEEIRTRFQTQYQECLEILGMLKQGEGALFTARMSVQDIGKMDLYQWLYFLALHQKRHIAQMEQVYREWTKEP